MTYFVNYARGGGGGGGGETNMKITLEPLNMGGSMGDGGVELTYLEYQKTEGKLGDYIYTYISL